MGKSASPIPGAPGRAPRPATTSEAEATGFRGLTVEVSGFTELTDGTLSPLDVEQATVPTVPSVLRRAAVAVVASRLDAIR
ncbi:hypothetical protein GCM10022252_59240 [Streptosporangium oxazolinicum]|uniref:FXSXX-COOH protein n=1 Tax=Streptosporangium oxazolinicum TaxID=909287 RepID=A0ABP8BBC4_9ACTN